MRPIGAAHTVDPASCMVPLQSAKPDLLSTSVKSIAAIRTALRDQVPYADPPIELARHHAEFPGDVRTRRPSWTGDLRAEELREPPSRNRFKKKQARTHCHDESPPRQCCNGRRRAGSARLDPVAR